MIFQGGEVTIEFASDGGYGFEQGAILPMIATAPVVYPGRDTNTRGARVETLQDAATVSRGGTFLQRMRPAIIAGFLLTPEGAPFVRLAPATRDTDPAFKSALWTYEQDITVEYMIKAREAVRVGLGPVAGRTLQQLLSDAVDLAQGYTNSNVYAVGHPVLEIQDEAVAQAVLSDLGFAANVDTDNVAASIVTPQ